jgi:MYXO-CTERM domain-containing protein
VSARGKLTPEEFALAFLAGGGFVLMMIAGGVGVSVGDAANASTYGMLFLLGLAALIAGAVLWAVLVRPWTQFDDINVPKDTGHHAGEHPGETAGH